MKSLILLFSLVSAVQPVTVNANEASGPCKADVEKFCKDVKPGGGRILRCLRDHKEELSEGCKEKGKEVKAKVEERREDIIDSCAEDFVKFCKGKRGPEARRACMRAHKDELSPACRQATEPAAKRSK